MGLPPARLADHNPYERHMSQLGCPRSSPGRQSDSIGPWVTRSDQWRGPASPVIRISLFHTGDVAGACRRRRLPPGGHRPVAGLPSDLRLGIHLRSAWPYAIPEDPGERAANDVRRASLTSRPAQVSSWASAGFHGAWLPPQSESVDAQGYIPQRWYRLVDHDSLVALLQDMNSRGMVGIADIVINHRGAPHVDPCTHE